MGYSPWGHRVGHDLATKPQPFGLASHPLSPWIVLAAPLSWRRWSLILLPL